MTVSKVLTSSEKIQFESVIKAQQSPPPPFHEIINQANTPSSTLPQPLTNRVSKRPREEEDSDYSPTPTKKARIDSTPAPRNTAEGLDKSLTRTSTYRRTYTYRNGSVYVGLLNRDGLPHGQGALFGPDKKPLYKGGFEKAKPHGKGIYTWSNGDLYEGEFEKGKPHGKGIYTWPSGDLYEGEMNEGYKEGYGILFAKNSTYEGNFVKNEFEGYGTKTYTNGVKYTGQWKSSKYDGQGTLEIPNNGRYEGQFENGQFHGEGEWTYADGRPSIVGRFERGQPVRKSTL